MEQVQELICPECKEQGTVRTFERGAGLGIHRRTVHGVIGTAESTVRARLSKELAKETEMAARGTRTPTEKIRDAIFKAGATGLTRGELGGIFPGRTENRPQLMSDGVSELIAQGLIVERDIKRHSIGAPARMYFKAELAPPLGQLPPTSPKQRMTPRQKAQVSQNDTPSLFDDPSDAPKPKKLSSLEQAVLEFLGSSPRGKTEITKRFAKGRYGNEPVTILNKFVKRGWLTHGFRPRANGVPGRKIETWEIAPNSDIVLKGIMNGVVNVPAKATTGAIAVSPSPNPSEPPTNGLKGLSNLINCRLCDFTTKSQKRLDTHMINKHPDNQTQLQGNGASNGNERDRYNKATRVITLTEEELELERLVGWAAGEAAAHTRIFAATENLPQSLFTNRVAEYLHARTVRKGLGPS